MSPFLIKHPGNTHHTTNLCLEVPTVHGNGAKALSTLTINVAHLTLQQQEQILTSLVFDAVLSKDLNLTPTRNANNILKIATRSF